MSHKEEQDKLLSTIVDKMFFEPWKNRDSESFTGLELIVSRKCNLKCKYCYYTNHGKELIPDELDNDTQKMLSNVSTLLQSLASHGIYPPSLSIFGGEALSISTYSQLFDTLYQFCSEAARSGKKTSIGFPTNTVLLLNDAYRELLVKQYTRFQRINAEISYSVSTDGKYCDPLSRPTAAGNDPYDNNYYKTVRAFSKEVHAGFHPMIAPENIGAWKKNLDWYMDYIFNNVESGAFYLLEVRNDNWTDQNLIDLREFVLYLGQKLLALYGTKEALATDLLARGSIFNMYRSYSTILNRGLTCSLQTQLYLRAADMAVVPCHRLSYPEYISGYLDPSTLELSAENVEVYIAELQANKLQLPQCATCDINYLCSGPCLGANVETTGTLFTPAPTMCRMEHTLQLSLIESFMDIGIIDSIIEALKQGTLIKNQEHYYKHALAQVLRLKGLIEGVTKNEE